MNLFKQFSDYETKYEIVYEPWQQISYESPILYNSNPILTRFNITLGGNNKSKPETITRMFENILYMPNLQYFDFILGYCNNINGELLKSLVSSIQLSKNLKSLNLSFDVDTLNTAKITLLDLKEIEFTFSQFSALEQFQFSLNRNQMKSLGFISTLLAYQTNLKILKLNLVNNDIQQTDINSVFDVFSKLQNLVELNVTIQRNFKAVSYVDRLFNAIQNLKNLSFINFSMDYCNLAEPKFNANQEINLKTLDMSFTNLQNFTPGFYEQFRYLNCMPNLEQLKITFGQNNKIGKCGLQILKETFLILKSLKNFSLKIDSKNEIEFALLSEMITSLDIFLSITDLIVSDKIQSSEIKGISKNGSKFITIEIVKDATSNVDLTRGIQSAINCIQDLKKIRIELMQPIRQMRYNLEKNSNIEEIEITVIEREENLKCILSLFKSTTDLNIKNLSIEILNSGDTVSEQTVYEFANSLLQFNCLQRLKFKFSKSLKIDGFFIAQSVSKNMHHDNFVADISFTPTDCSSEKNGFSELINTLIESSKYSQYLKLFIDDYENYMKLTLKNIVLQINYTAMNPRFLIESFCYGLISLVDSTVSFEFEYKSEAIKLKAKNSINNCSKPCEMFDVEKTLESINCTQNEFQNSQQKNKRKMVDYSLLFDTPYKPKSPNQYRCFILQCSEFKLFLNSNTIQKLDLTCYTQLLSTVQCCNSLFSMRELKSLMLSIFNRTSQIELYNKENQLIRQKQSKLTFLKIQTLTQQNLGYKIKRILPRLCKSHFTCVYYI